MAVLSDILGEEDHLGDMDFKVAGTEKGITGFQMDIKIAGVSPEVMRKAMDQAKRGRLHILSIMNKTLDKPSQIISEYAPKITSLKIDPEKLGLLIGPGGKNIKALLRALFGHDQHRKRRHRHHLRQDLEECRRSQGRGHRDSGRS
jgi:polyribonucleotide nucleotidyltransferase